MGFRPHALIVEFKRRKVLQVGATYLLATWVAIQVGATVTPVLAMPSWVPWLITVVAIVGFPLVLTLSWFYDIGRHGITRSASADASNATTALQLPMSAATATSIKSMAVMPLDEIDTESGDLLADGLTEALITDLAHASGLKVISRSSVVRFRNTTMSLQNIARQLGVDALVTGSVRRGGTRIRISVELIEPISERVLWADRFDRELEDVLRIQVEIAKAITGELKAHVGQSTEGADSAPQRVNPEAYMLDLKGRRLMEARTEEGFHEALLSFQHALDRDPTYGTSFLGIARCHNMLANYGIELPSQARACVQAALEHATHFGAANSEVHGELALMHWQIDFEWSTAEAEFQRALELSPNNARLWYWYGIVLAVRASFDAAFDALARAEELDPLSTLVPAVRGWVLYFMRQHSEAVNCLRELLHLNPELAPAHWFLGMSLVELGDHANAIEAYESSIKLTGRISRLLGYLGHAHGRSGNDKQANALLAELKQRSNHVYVPSYFLALVHVGLGDYDSTMDELHKAWVQRDCMLRDLLVDASFDALRRDGRFERLIAEMNIP